MSNDSSAKISKYTATSYALYLVQDTSLKVMLSTLPDDKVVTLCNFVEPRIARGSVFVGNGQVLPVDFGIEPAHCYFCMISPHPDTQYIVCFITEANRGLDSFKTQLDQYSSKIEMFIKSLTAEASLADRVKTLLESWYKDCLLFIVNCVQRLGTDIKYIIYNAVANGQMSIDTDDKQLESDLERLCSYAKFHASCNLSALLNHSVDSGSDTSGSLVEVDTEPQSRTKRNVDILCVTCRHDEITFSDRSTTKFCQDWAQVLFEKYAYSMAETGDVNPLDLKTISETFKLKTIQDMNTLKRMVKQAELDFYALYKSSIFVRKSGNSPILLLHALNEEQSTDAVSILKLLQDYVENDKLVFNS